MISLENDVVIGTFTNSDEYYPSLLSSVRTFLPNVEFILHLDNKPINQNFEELRKKFLATGKRYWVFLDHDIRFLDSEIITTALSALIRNKWALVGVYSTYYPEYIAKKEELVEKEVGWVPGYFQMVDSRYVGNVSADLSLPHPNTAIDTSYCVSIRSLGYKIGIASAYVWHQYKPLNMQYLSVIDMTNNYLRNKWGQFYFDTCVYCGCLVGGDPGRDVWNLSEEDLQKEMESLFNERCNPKAHGAMGSLMHVLKDYASKYESVTELGVQKGSSTIGFAMGKPKVFRSYELMDVMEERTKALLGRYAGWKYTIADSRKISIEETDILFIDTDHVYEQLLAELNLHHKNVKHCILLHDLGNCGIWGERGIDNGLLQALNEFIELNPEWFIEKTYMHDHCLTVLRRIV